MRRAVLMAGLMVASVAVAYGNRAGVSAISLDDPAIQYNTRMPHDEVSYLNQRIMRGQVHLKYEKPQGYLRSVLDASRELAAYMLFADEKPLPSNVEGTSGFAEKFSSEGPKDNQGRSLRQFDLERRLMRYPCSYMIYSSAFDALPDDLKDATYAGMWRILSGEEHRKRYAVLTLEDRRAIVEILRETKRRLPEYFQAVTR